MRRKPSFSTILYWYLIGNARLQSIAVLKILVRTSTRLLTIALGLSNWSRNSTQTIEHFTVQSKLKRRRVSRQTPVSPKISYAAPPQFRQLVESYRL